MKRAAIRPLFVAVAGFAFPWTLLLVAPNVQTVKPGKKEKTWAIAYVFQNEVVTAKMANSYSSGVRLQVTFEPIKSNGKVGRIYDQFPTFLNNGFLRWRIAFGELWQLWFPAQFQSVQFVYPISELARFESKPGSDRLSAPSPVAEYSNHGKYSWGFEPVARLLTRYGFGTDEEAASGVEIHHDFLPTSASTGILFILEKNRLRTWSCERMPYGQPNKWSKTERETIAVEQFDPEPFQVFGTEQRFHILLRSGRLFSSDKPASGARTLQESRWATKYDPMAAVIVDVNSGKHHCLALREAGEGKQRGYYFEMNEPDKAVEVHLWFADLKQWLSPSIEVRIRTFLKYLIDKKLLDPH